MGNENKPASYDPDVMVVARDDVEKNLEKIRILERQNLINRNIIAAKNNEITAYKKTLEEREAKYETTRSELAKYESVPALKQILDLYENLRVFRQEMEKTDAGDSIEDVSLAAKIFDKKKQNKKMENNLNQKSLSPEQTKQLTQAQEQLNEAERTLKSTRGFTDYKQMQVSLLTENVKLSMKEFDGISDGISKVERQLKKYQDEFAVLQNKGVQMKRQEREECEKILTLLDMHYSAMWGLLKMLGTPEDDNIFKIDESDGVIDSAEGTNRYAIMLYNLNEGHDDLERVKNIINSICPMISTDEIEVLRLGKYNINKIRPIKVFVPTFKHVKEILSNRLQLKTGSYQYINIGAFNRKNEAGKGRQAPNEKSATFAFS